MDLFKVIIEDARYLKQQEDHDGGHDGRQRDAEKFCRLARAVDIRRLVKRLVYGAQRGDIYDAAVARALPHVGNDHDPAEKAGISQNARIFGYQPEFLEHHAEQTAFRSEIAHEAAHDHHGDEIRHIDHGLRHPTVGFHLDVVHQKRQNDGGGKHDEDIEQAENQRVADQPPEIRIGKKGFEMIENIRNALEIGRPRAAENALRGFIVLKRRDQPHHGEIGKDDKEHHYGQDHDIQGVIAAEIGFQPHAKSFVMRGRSSRPARFHYPAFFHVQPSFREKIIFRGISRTPPHKPPPDRSRDRWCSSCSRTVRKSGCSRPNPW